MNMYLNYFNKEENTEGDNMPIGIVTVELGAEGFRYDDIRRWAAHKLFKGKRPKVYPFLASEWISTKINHKVDSDGFLDLFVGQMPNGYGFNENRDYLKCVPLNEITLNVNLKQNPGWE